MSSAYQPLTRIAPETKVTFEELARRIVQTREDHGPLLQQFHEVFYNAPHTWHYTHFLGVGTMKCPNDLWMYQALVSDWKPKTIIETGTYQGASALWFAFLMDMLRVDGGRVYTVDIEDRRKCNHPRITFLEGSSTDPALVEALADEVAAADGPLLVSLDSDHSAAHVRQELELYAPLCRKEDWLVVEDTNIGWDAADPALSDRGARGGLEDYLRVHPGEWRQDVICERYLLTMHPGGWLQKVI
jgi:cephalosporin hydroxylase